MIALILKKTEMCFGVIFQWEIAAKKGGRASGHSKILHLREMAPVWSNFNQIGFGLFWVKAGRVGVPLEVQPPVNHAPDCHGQNLAQVSHGEEIGT